MKNIFTVLAAISLSASVLAQAPQKMSYQAVIRNSSNTLITSTAVGIKISILQGTATGSAIYVETQMPTTNANGLANLEINTGVVVSGNFSTINWGNGPYFIKIETDPLGGTAYSITGTSQLASVPYALFAENVNNYSSGTGISIVGNTISNTAPDQTITITGTGGINVTGTYPNYTLNTPRMIYGATSGGGANGSSPSLISGGGFTVTKFDIGIYDVVYTTPFSSIPTIAANIHYNNFSDGADGYHYYSKIYNESANGFRIATIIDLGTSLGSNINTVGFSIIAIGN